MPSLTVLENLLLPDFAAETALVRRLARGGEAGARAVRTLRSSTSILCGRCPI